ncbi:MAG: tail fiber domain-containing protein [Saprospiraceae bacterium]|nr:tail fiber domain-containing protein [Saprospiraceae bacterium]
MGIRMSEGTLPNTTLDVNGAVSFREASPLLIVNGANNNVVLDSMSFYRIVAPTQDFSISGFTNGTNGRLLTLINATSRNLTLKNKNAASTAPNQILNGFALDLLIGPSGTVSLVYNSSLQKWVVIASFGALSGASVDWSLLGNAQTTPSVNFIGTTDNKALRFRTNNVERLTIDSIGYIGIGTTLPKTKVSIIDTVSTDTFIRGLQLINYSNSTNSGRINLAHSRGTSTTPSPVVTSDFLATYGALGYDGSSLASAGHISYLTSENWSSSKHGSKIWLSTIANGSTQANVRMSIEQNGAIGIGTVTPKAVMHIVGDGLSGYNLNGTSSILDPCEGPEIAFSRCYMVNPAASIQLIDYQNYSGGLAFNVHKGTSNAAAGSNTDNWPNDVIQAMTIVNNGRIGIGTSNPDQLLSVNGNASKSGGGTWATFSDKRLKRNIKPFTEGVGTIQRINPVWFQYNSKSGYTDTAKLYVGIIAQEIETVLPYTVNQIKTLSFDDQRIFDGSALTYILINAVKEQQAEIDNLKKENTLLKNQFGQIEELKASFEILKAKLSLKQ